MDFIVSNEIVTLQLDACDVQFGGDSMSWDDLSTGRKKQHQYNLNSIDVEYNVLTIRTYTSNGWREYTYNFDDCVPIFAEIAKVLDEGL